jgi:hypothetical protein
LKETSLPHLPEALILVLTPVAPLVSHGVWVHAQVLLLKAMLVFGADDTVARQSARELRAKGCYRAAVRFNHPHIIRNFGLKWVYMMLLVPGS